jgi:hypothetical protein
MDATRNWCTTQSLTSGTAVPATFLKTNDLDIVLFCGSPGAGKSSFYWKHMQPLGYARVNQDILKTVGALTHLDSLIARAVLRFPQIE